MKSATHAAPDRQLKARDFYEQGVRQLEAGKALAAAASFKLAMTYDSKEQQYRVKYEEAVDASRATTAEGFFKRAAFEESVGRLEAAGKLFVRAAEAMPIALYLRRAAIAMLWVDDLAKAKDYASQAIQNEPNSADARLALAEVLLRSGDKRGAKREVELALRTDSANQDAAALMERVKRA
jgi:tetratricopeptide (TPR) repeat protein